MKIICFVKHAPDSAARIKIDGSGKSIESEGIDFGPSPFDEYGVENALKIKEATQAEIVVVALGPEAALNSLRKILAMGADRGIHLKTNEQGDARAVGKALANVIKDEKADLLFFGYQAIDTNDGQVPTYVCHELDYPLINVVTELKVEGSQATAHRQIEGAQEIVSVGLPAAFACTKGKNEPRFPSLPGIMKAKKKPVETHDLDSLTSQNEILKLEPPPEKQAASFVGEGVEAIPELISRLKNEAKIL